MYVRYLGYIVENYQKSGKYNCTLLFGGALRGVYIKFIYALIREDYLIRSDFVYLIDLRIVKVKTILK